MHTAVIRQIAASRDCSLLVSGSEDKSVRLWRLPSGRALATLRPPSGEDNNGRVYSVAMPPDGQWIAAGGWTRPGANHFVHIFDPDKRTITARLGPFEVIDHLAASEDGSLLAASLRNGQGLRVWERRSATEWVVVRRDTGFAKGDVKGVAFGPDRTLYAVAHDGSLRRYPIARDGRVGQQRVRSGLKPTSVAVSPDGRRLLVGYADTTAVDVYDSQTLQFIHAVNTRGLANGNLASVAWSRDGSRVYAGGTYAEDGRQVLLSWDAEGRADKPQRVGSASDAILSLAACGDGIAMASGEPGLGLFAGNSERLAWLGPAGPDMRSKLRTDFTVSSDGSRVRFGLRQGSAEPVLLDLASEQLVEQPDPLPDLLPARTTGLPVTDWENSRTPRFSGRVLSMDPEERAQSLAIAPDGASFVIGGDYQLRAYDKNGQYLWRRKAPGVVWGVNIAGNGQVLVAACGDGSLRWYRMSDGAELLSFFVSTRDLRWVAWSPSGYFTASSGGENMVGWQITRAGNPTPDYFPVNKFRDIYYRPDIINRVLSARDEDRAINIANQALQRKRDTTSVATNLPPVIRIVSPRDGSLADGEVKVQFAVRHPTGKRLRRVFAQLDGRPAEGAEMRDLDVPAGAEADGEIVVKVPTRDKVTLSLIAEPEKGPASEPARVDLIGPAQDDGAIKPRLFILGVGIGAYKDDKLALGEFPRNDVLDFAEEMKKQEKVLFEKVTPRLLLDADASHKSITEGLQWLIDSAKEPEDMAVLYFSGHGASVPAGASYLLPYDYDRSRITTGLSKNVIMDALRSIEGPVLFFVDACHAGEDLKLGAPAGIRRLDAMSLATEFSAFENGITAFASSNGRQLSYGAGRNSYFTQALIDSLRGAGPRTGNKVVTDDVNYWLRRRVPELSKGKQLPVMMSSPFARPLPLAVIN
ncbi:MAG: caspase family protein [Hyphomicrobiaceae bacterium]|nr:caspase family protein [Hyphomicrobiaceae bacterium]